MATSVIRLALPEELVALLGSAERAATRARTALVLDLLRKRRLSQGQTARILDLTRWELLELMGQRGIASGPETAEEMRQEIESARRIIAHT